MRIGKSIEGSPEEIRNLCENHGLRIEDFLERPKDKSMSAWWLRCASGTYTIVLILLAILPKFWPNSVGVLGLLAFASVVWVVVCLQLTFDNGWASGFAGAGLAVVILIAMGIMSPAAAVEYFRDLRKD
jgi:hypothetical protein